MNPQQGSAFQESLSLEEISFSVIVTSRGQLPLAKKNTLGNRKHFNQHSERKGTY
jgi:hypothetical protein